ncbi:hypothetical protein AQUCO_01600359v1 [Aquilegia coerulea]|uniref:Uncharacterized protein n=1 Tax=Aquilegia coerulea TaxID=218851 RepID=A0A2G5DR81_AQUCA|nr:hypothetical protein AQUCO_01600359v1 [Aquilegia coerulea]
MTFLIFVFVFQYSIIFRPSKIHITHLADWCRCRKGMHLSHKKTHTHTDRKKKFKLMRLFKTLIEYVIHVIFSLLFLPHT